MSPATTLQPTWRSVGLVPTDENIVSLPTLVTEGHLQKTVSLDVTASMFNLPTPVLPMREATTEGELHTPAFDMDFDPFLTKAVSDNDCNFTLDSIFEPVEPKSSNEDYCGDFSPGSSVGLPEREDSFNIVNSATEMEFVCDEPSPICVPYLEAETVEESSVTIDTKPALKVNLAPSTSSNSFIWNDLITINTPELLDFGSDAPFDLMSYVLKNVDEINLVSASHVESVPAPVTNTKATDIAVSRTTEEPTSLPTSRVTRKRKAELTSNDDLSNDSKHFHYDDDESHYRRMRDTNNEASRRSRQNRKNWEKNLARTAEAMEQRHTVLVSKSEQMQRLVHVLRKALVMAVTKK